MKPSRVPCRVRRLAAKAVRRGISHLIPGLRSVQPKHRRRAHNRTPEPLPTLAGPRDAALHNTTWMLDSPLTCARDLSPWSWTEPR